MKKLLFILFLLSTFPALADDSQLPQQFLGWWHPFSATTAGIAIDIKSDEKIITIHKKTREIQGTSRYLYLYSPTEKDALLLVYPYYIPKTPKIWSLERKIEDSFNPERYVLIVIQHSCNISSFKKDQLSRDYLVKYIKDGKCNLPDDRGLGESMDTYTRTKK